MLSKMVIKKFLTLLLLRNYIIIPPDGFNWGYSGSGPAQAALGILLYCVGKDTAVLLYQLFKFDFVAVWDDDFSISEKIIKNWIKTFKK